ncbi:hypothetical protein PJL18_00213 [Paenarthrobacter nicotinovorans]|nr:hypothetical protein [Paenarthrobacter nicotinovorans]
MTAEQEAAIMAQLLSRPAKLDTCNACKKALNGNDECDCS